MSTIYTFHQELPAVTAADVQPGDVLLIYDTSAGTTRRATVNDLISFTGSVVTTATATVGTATLNGLGGRVTTETLTTAGAAFYTLTLTNSSITVGDMIMWSIANGSNTLGMPVPSTVVAAAGTATFKVGMASATAAAGTFVISFKVFKA